MCGKAASQAFGMHGSVKRTKLVGKRDGTPAPCGRSPLRANVLISKDSPVTQIEIEVIAALLDDWDGIEPSAQEDHSK
ncbi:MAG TPA: hypothetical protein VII56_06215 [Rhizomicrobium sp.]